MPFLSWCLVMEVLCAVLLSSSIETQNLAKKLLAFLSLASCLAGGVGWMDGWVGRVGGRIQSWGGRRPLELGGGFPSFKSTTLQGKFKIFLQT